MTHLHSFLTHPLPRGAALGILLVLGTLAPLPGCTGLIGDGAPADAHGPGGPDARPDGPLFPDGSCDEVAFVPTELRRLTRPEVEATLRDLVGDATFDEAELTFGSFPTDSVGAGATEGFAPLHSAAHVDAMIATSDVIAETFLGPDGIAGAAAAGYPCVLEAEPTSQCAREFAAAFGRRAFRRPVTAEELTDLVSYFEETPDPREGLHRLMMRILASPQLLFHLEIDGREEDQDDGSALVLDHYSVASRISYAVLGSMPTDRLLDAAEREELGTTDEVEAWVRTLLEEPRAKEHFAHFIESWLMVGEIEEASNDLASRSDIRQQGLREAMVEELETFAEQLFFGGADYQTLMTSPATFAEDPRVAAIYEVPTYEPGEAPPESGTERGGLLLRAAMLLSAENTTAPILRGVKVRRQVLCEALPTPGNDVVNSRLDDLDDLDPREHTGREIIDDMTGDSPCNSCHQAINPIAFALDEFDQLGRFRTVEEVWVDDELIAEHPIDPGVDLQVDTGVALHVESAMELVTAIAESDRGHACFAQRLFEHVHLRAPTAEDGCQVSSVYERLRDGGGSLLDAYVATVAQEAILTRALSEEL